MKGATWLDRLPDTDSINFNPRTREGCDPFQPFAFCNFRTISIHAPVKGATNFREVHS